MAFIFPVIHHKDNILALEQAKIAHDCGANGVFLISHHGKDNLLPALAKEIKSLYPSLKVGLNLLSTHITEAVKIVKDNDLDMVWGDYCGVTSKGFDETGVFLEVWASNNPSILLFASVAFKYQSIDNNPSQAALNAYSAGFIPTTSGEATGVAPTLDKIQLMSKAVNGNLAIASGMTIENVELFINYLSHILVATGVSKDEYRFDEILLSKFIRINSRK